MIVVAILSELLQSFVQNHGHQMNVSECTIRDSSDGARKGSSSYVFRTSYHSRHVSVEFSPRDEEPNSFLPSIFIVLDAVRAYYLVVRII